MNTINPNSYGPLDVGQLEELEKTIGTKLPEDYRAFLVEFNGSRPEKRAFMAPEDPLEEEGEWSERELVGFYGLHNHNIPIDRDTMDAFKLNEAWADLQNDVPGNTLLPIGQDWSGNYVCLQLNPENFGEVCFFDHEYEVETKLAEDFSAFVESLTEESGNED